MLQTVRDMKYGNSLMLAASIAFLFSCGEPSLDLVGMIDGRSPDVNERFATSAESGPETRTVVSPTADYKVYVGTDMHIGIGSPTKHTDAFLESFRADADAPMALILGDLVNDSKSMKRVSDHIREKASAKAGCVFPALGNHDIYFKLWEQWAAEWGSAHYKVEVRTPAGSDLYVCMESASGYLGTRQLAWLKETLEDSGNGKYRHLVVFTHTHMFKKDGSQGHTSNYPLEETWELTSLFERSGVELFLSGHCHSRDIAYFNGVEYVVVDALDEDSPDSMTGYMTLEAGERLDCIFSRFDDRQTRSQSL